MDEETTTETAEPEFAETLVKITAVCFAAAAATTVGWLAPVAVFNWNERRRAAKEAKLEALNPKEA